MISQEAIQRGIRIRQTQEGAWVRRRKNGKPWFDHWRFAEDQGISPDWLFEGDLRAHPRGAAPRPHQSRRLTDGDAA